MLRASKIGTPDVTNVPSVRVVRARMFFSTKLPKTGTLMMYMSYPIRPCLNLRINFPISQITTGNKNISQK
ncbi:MAG: hypothetical protein ACK55Z_22130 [bacterium]